MILVEEGLLGLNRPVRDYVPEFEGEGKNQVLIRQLFTHTTGLESESLVKQAADECYLKFKSGQFKLQNWTV